MRQVLSRRNVLFGGAAVLLLLLGGLLAGPVAGSAESGTNYDICDDNADNEEVVAPGTLDDGAELLPQAKITLEQAIAAAQAAQNGPVGEVDLEYENGRLVFNVDIGQYDVSIDASDGSVVRSVKDD